MRLLSLSLGLLAALASAQDAAAPAPAGTSASASTTVAAAPQATAAATTVVAAAATTSVTWAMGPDDGPPPTGGPPHPTPSIWSYPQSPLPQRTASAPAAAFTVADNIAPWFPRTRRYNFNLGFSAGSPSGFLRRMTTINNQFPGPLIEGWQGDIIEVTVTNNLDFPQSMHWHGLIQNATGGGLGSWYDGVPGITQCPIQPGKSFTYRFKLDNDAGTYWYHSHFGNTLADGVFGGLVIHSKTDPLKKSGLFSKGDFDQDKIMFMHDWYHDQSEFIIKRFLNWTEGYRGGNIPKMPDAVVMNGLGQENCAIAQPGVSCKTNGFSETRARVRSKLRLRLINPGSLGHLRFSIDNHVLKVVEIDDTPIKPIFVQEISLDPGQRYSVIVHLNQGGFFSSFWMRAKLGSRCILGGYPLEAKSVLRYTDFLGIAWSRKLPTSAEWPVPYIKDPTVAPCIDFADEYNAQPLNPVAPPQTVFATHRFDSAFGTFVNQYNKYYTGFGFNPYHNGVASGPVAYMNLINNPLMKRIQEGVALNSSQLAAITLDQLGAADIIINQLDVGLQHPFHMHGRPFFVIAHGKGVMTEELLKTTPLNLVNPIKRDTFTIGTSAWAVIRLITDTPGVWPLHCHIGWHLSEGKLAVVVVRPDKIKQFEKPPQWQALCNGLNPNEIGPGRRSLPPQARSDAELEEREVQIKPTPVQQMPAPTDAPDFDSPHGRNVPYFSMDGRAFTLIDRGVTVTETVTVPAGAEITAANDGVTVDTKAASAAYATLTNRPAEALWSGEGAVAESAKATEGATPAQATAA